MKLSPRQLRLERLEDRTVPSSPGDIDWLRQFGSVLPAESHGYAAAVAGDVYVAGYVTGALPGQTSTGDQDGYVRKYDTAGNVLWTRQFGATTPGPQGFLNDRIFGVAGDASGVYVVGQTTGTLPGQVFAGGTSDAFVRKYDPAGNELWTRQFGSAVEFDVANDVAVDASGVYVVGQIRGSGGDAFVRKYDLSGNLLWNSQFGSSSGDAAVSIAADASGVYVSGSFGGPDSGLTGQGPFVRKYDANGNPLWIYHTSAGAIAVDASGFYIAGTVGGVGSDVLVAKYGFAGNLVWSRQFGATTGIGNVFTDIGYDIGVDASGVYVAGESDGHLPGQANWGAFVRKYDLAGNEQWTRQFGPSTPQGLSAGSSARGLAVDASGIYVVGDTRGTLPGQTSTGGVDAFVRKYDAGGNELWTRQSGSTSPATDVARAVDADGNVYLVGRLGASGSFVRKYDAVGNELWIRQLLNLDVRGIAVDASGVYATGTTPLNSQDGFVRKYDAAGNEVWTRQFGTNFIDSADGIAADASGIYVAGFTFGTFAGQASAGGEDAFVSKYDAAGNQLWTRQFGTSGTDHGTSVAVDAAGIYVTGFTNGAFPGQTSAGGQDAFVRKYDAGGAEIWTRQFGTSAADSATGVAADASGVYVSGFTAGTFAGQTSAGSNDAFVRKYDAGGTALWTRQFGSAGSDQANGVAVGAAGVYVAGQTGGILPGQTSAGGQDAFVGKFDASGAAIWTRQFGTASTDSAAGVAVGTAGIYVAGFTTGTFPGQTSTGLEDAFVAKIVDTVPNTAPSNVVLNLNSSINENGTATLDGSFTDPDTADTHTVVINWGPGEGTTTLNLAAGVTTFSAGHPYLDDNPTGSASDIYTISATVTDPAGGSAGGGTSVTVNNVAPTVTGLNVTPNPVNENGTVALTGSFTDPGTRDTHTVVISWGPGEGTTTLSLAAGVLTVSASHQYLDDNPSGTAADGYTISVTVTDDDTGSGSGSTAVTVNNVAPVVTITSPAPGSVFTVGTPITLTGAITDAGTADTHTAEWTFGAVTIAGSVTQGSGSGTVSDSYTFSAPGVYSVKLTVADDDGGTGSDLVLITVVKRPTATSVSSPANPSVFGQPVTLTATVSDAVGGSGIPGGTVQFRVDGSDFGSPVSLVSGAASFSTAGLSAGPHTITAVYGGDGSFAPSTSEGLSQVVNRAATATAVSVSAPTPLFGADGVTISATIAVVAPGSGDPAGTVTFYDGTAALGTANLVSGAASLALGNTALAAGSHTIRAVYSGDGNFLGSDSTAAVNVLAPSTIQGLVYVDFNNDGQVDLGERAVASVTVTLAGTDDLGQGVSRTIQTDANGVYAFIGLRPSNAAGYTFTETQPAGLLDGRDTLGTVNSVPTGSAAVNDTFSGVVLSQGGSVAENYNFGERPATNGGVAVGQTATIGYWQNPNGQNLVRSLNGGATATQLGHWLAVSFPNLYGTLDGVTNAGVAAFYKGLFARTAQTAPGGPPKVDAQVMATALAVYVTNQALAGTTATAYGFQVTATGLGTRTFNVGCNGVAFGVANNSSLSVMDLLLAVNARAHNGLLYDLNGNGRIDGSEAGYRTMANDLFTAINEAGDI